MPAAHNKRKYSRFQFSTEVKISLGDNRAQDGVLINLSLGGAFIETLPPLPFGARVKLQIRLPGVPDACDIPCIVRWARSGKGAGLQFEQLRAIEVWALSRLITTLPPAFD
ncbi:MAG: PilZ domain-containing protein [Myxococcota bacterium]|nr:PilZ domain-containing protein [Myxococcota bacterium]